MNPENPDQVEVTRPSDALEAQQAAEEAFTNLLLGLGSVALLVGGVAIANVMVMSVLERRMEIGVRRSIGATRREIRYQFLLESIVLSGIGGLVGVLLGTVITLGYTNYTNIVFSIPVWQIFGAVLLAFNRSYFWFLSSYKSIENSTSRGSSKVKILAFVAIFTSCTIGGEEPQGVVTIESTTVTTIVDEETTLEEGVL